MTEEETSNAILEGCYEEPSRVHYNPIKIFIPENASVLRIKDSYNLFLYGKFDGFKYSGSKIISTCRNSQGWLLRDETNKSNPGWISHVFEMPRSITTSDGRIYIKDIFYAPKWEWYFSIVPMILNDCSDFFSGRKNRDELTVLVRRAF